MQVKPIENYRTPSYPDREEMLANPNLLKTLPERWRGNVRVVVAVSSLLAMTLTSCSSQKVGSSNGGTSHAGQAAPIFIHGDGRGSFGCDSVAPPAFLSEEEAFSVISEEAKRVGINFSSDTPVIKNVKIPKTDLNYDPEGKGKTQGQNGDLTLDGLDKSAQIAFEFVSKDDMHAWLDKNNGSRSSVDFYDFISAAGVVAEGIRDKTGSMTVATFYDPHYKYDANEIQKIIKSSKSDYEKMERLIKEKVKDDLRAQVKDFLSWLKGQGII